jgi:plasmid stabilization system protein ParE
MGYEVKITSRANRDLIEILDYTESHEHDVRPAIRFTNALVEEALSLSELPYRGRIMNRRKRIRQLVFHDYLILFEIKESVKRVEVLRFVHGSHIK